MDASNALFAPTVQEDSQAVVGSASIIQERLPTNSQLMPINFDAMATSESNFRCLIATDCHLGFRDREPLVKDDSMRAFEEVLQLAKEKNVDTILMAGDLFHHNRPSRITSTRATDLIQRYCLGDKPVNINFLSNPKENFAHAEPHAQKPNWEDPNVNIELPIFSIHGNHDDPIGPRTLCEVDTLHQQRLVNYFGKVEDFSEILLKPIVLEKAGTMMALYGLGSIKDERLNHLMRAGKVKFIRPAAFTTSDGRQYTANDMFSILLFHQNRVPRGPKNYIPENMLPDWLDLIVWGHEHDSIPQVSETRFFDDGVESIRRVLQPGSTVATSLSVGEALPKHVFILHVQNKDWNIEAIPLKTVRPFFMRDIDLRMMTFDETVNKQVQVETYLVQIVEDLIKAAKEQASECAERPEEPLIRLRVEYGTDAQPLNQKRFGQRFLGRVACPDEILLANRRQKMDPTKLKGLNIKREVKLTTTTLEDFITEKLGEQNATMKIQDLALFLEALKLRVDKEDKTAILDMVNFQNFDAKTKVLANKPEPSAMSTAFDNYVENRKLDVDEEMDKFHKWRVEMIQHVKEAADQSIQRSQAVAPFAEGASPTTVEPLSPIPRRAQRLPVRGRPAGPMRAAPRQGVIRPRYPIIRGAPPSRSTRGRPIPPVRRRVAVRNSDSDSDIIEVDKDYSFNKKMRSSHTSESSDGSQRPTRQSSRLQRKRYN